MPDDLLLTQEEQNERAKQWLKDNLLSIVVGVAIGLGAIFGFNTYQDKRQNQAEQASLQYAEVLTRAQQSDITDITEQVDTLKAEYGSTQYAAKAALIRAKQLTVTDSAQAIEELKWVLDNAGDEGILHTARIRLARLYISDDKLEQAATLAEKYVDTSFASHYQELLGDIATRQQRWADARTHYEQAQEALSQADANYAPIIVLKLNQLPE